MRTFDDTVLFVCAALVALALTFSGCPGVTAGSTAAAQATRYSLADALLAAQACVHEATWAGGRGGTADCGGIIQVAEHSRAPGETFSSALRRRMPRFAAGTSDRAWVLGLPAGPLRVAPAGWPFRVPARHYAPAWSGVFARVSDYMHEREPLPCSPEPMGWFGRETDGDALAARLATGLWRESDCGTTHNAFVYQIDPD